MPLSSANPNLAAGIRPFEAKKDLSQVAALVSEAFASELDAESRLALRDLKKWGKFLELLGLGAVGPGNAFSLLDGFVWVEHARVVGNVSLQRLDAHGHCWQIANMAVARPYQRRGIAKQLLGRAQDHLRNLGVQYAVLQVCENNQVARTLYDRHGFKRMGGVAELTGHTPLQAQEVPARGAARPIPGREWRQIYDLAQGQMEHHLKWWRPLKKGDFVHDWPQQVAEGIARVLNLGQVQRFGIKTKAGQLAAAAIVKSHYLQGRHDIALWTRPQLYGMYEPDLIGTTLHSLAPRRGLLVQVKVDADHKEAIDGLAAWGLHKASVLHTMRCRIA